MKAQQGRQGVAAVHELVHFGNTKPFFDREGRAVEAMEKVGCTT